MGYHLTEPMTGLTAESAAARPSALRKKKGLGAPFLQAILSTKYCDSDLGLYYYGFRFLSPGLGRWLSRDPIGDVSFQKLYADKRFNENFTNAQAIVTRLEMAYVGNMPVDNIDYMGLDRWVGGFPHPYIIVEEWSADCKRVINWRRIDYGAVRWEPFCCGVVTITYERPSEKAIRIASTCSEDRILLETALALERDPPQYNVFFFNCRHFIRSIRDIGINGNDGTYTIMPIIPPVSP